MGNNDAAEMLEVAKEECVRLERELAVVGSFASRELARMQSTDAALRGIHVMELFGDCVEDGQRFPCRTIQVLNVVRAHTPPAVSELPVAEGGTQ
jgi:hypothetical protein